MATAAAIARGTSVVAAAGNDAVDAANSTPKPRAGFVWSTVNDGTHGPGNLVYTGYAGTSIATPHIAGIIALMLNASDDAKRTRPTPAQVRKMLVQTSTAFSVTPTLRIGAGIANAAAVARASGAPGGVMRPPPSRS